MIAERKRAEHDVELEVVDRARSVRRK